MAPARPKPRLIDWLQANGSIIGRDAAVSVSKSKAGHVITFTWSYDGRRDLRLTFSGVTPEERKDSLIAWLNGDFLPRGGGT